MRKKDYEYIADAVASVPAFRRTKLTKDSTKQFVSELSKCIWHKAKKHFFAIQTLYPLSLREYQSKPRKKGEPLPTCFQCHHCGIRIPCDPHVLVKTQGNIKHIEDHLDAHVTKNLEEMTKTQSIKSRMWYSRTEPGKEMGSKVDPICLGLESLSSTSYETEEEGYWEVKEGYKSDTQCTLCGETFQPPVYLDDLEGWAWKNVEPRDVDSSVHSMCNLDGLEGWAWKNVDGDSSDLVHSKCNRGLPRKKKRKLKCKYFNHHEMFRS